jgi:hypothetical protein
VRPQVQRLAWAPIAVSAALLLASFYMHPLGPAISLLLAGLAVLSGASPYRGLLVLAALAPLATVIAAVLRLETPGVRAIEGLTLAFLAGWTMRRVIQPSPLPLPSTLRWTSSALMAAALASAVVAAVTVFAETTGDALLAATDDRFRSYAIFRDPVSAAFLFVEGVMLMVAVADLCWGRDDDNREGMLRMLIVGGAAAAAFNLMRIVIDGALRHEHPWSEFVRLLLHYRVNVHHTDLNAAGSYFAMLWFPALALVRRHRPAGAACLLLISTGLWITGSRVALGGVVIVAAAAAVLRWKGRRSMVPLLGAAVLAAIVAGVLWRTLPQRHVAAPELALKIRLGLAAGALAMAADHPWFGVGLGRFYPLSETYVHVPNYIVRENAHNNFLQVLAELGVLGLWPFLTVVGLAIAAARAAPRRDTWPVLAGLAAFLLTCLGGHPLLVPHAAFPFWMSVGVAASWPEDRERSLVRRAALATLAILLVALPWRAVAAVRSADMTHASLGFSDWQRLDDGRRIRRANARATFYVTATARSVRIPVRAANAGDSLVVRIFLDDVEANRVTVTGASWTSVEIVFAGSSQRAFRRLSLQIAGTSTPPAGADAPGRDGVLLVGQPEID